MVDKQRAFAKLLEQGASVSEACRRLGIDRKTGLWWKNGGVGVTPTGRGSSNPSSAAIKAVDGARKLDNSAAPYSSGRRDAPSGRSCRD
jgi:transposase-like protein